MKKASKLLGLLLLSGMVLTGCDEDKFKLPKKNSDADVTENQDGANDNKDNNADDNNAGDDNTGDDNGNNNEYGDDNTGDDNGNTGDNGGTSDDNGGSTNTGDDNNGGSDDNGGNSGDDNGNTGDDNGNTGDDSGDDNGDDNGGGTPAKEDWDEDEKNVFVQAFYGIDIPYQYFPGEEPLEYYADYGTAFKYSEEVTPELLDSYYEMFDESWDDYSEPEKNYYYLETFIDTDEGVRAVCVEFYAADEYGDSVNDGNGALFLMIYQPYTYVWPDSKFNEVYEDFELVSTVPAYNGGYLYEFEEGYLSLGYLAFGVYCYTDSKTAEEDYLDELTKAGFTVYDTNEEGLVYYADENEEFTICFVYDESYGSLDIFVEEIYNFDLDGDVLDAESFGITEPTTSYEKREATGESGVEYEGYTAGAHGIQIRSNDSTSGIVSKTSGGFIVGIGVTFNSQTVDSRVLNVYASNEPFETTDMYDEDSEKCVYVGSITLDQTAFIFLEEYTYIGIRSAYGAIYLDEIVIEWETGEDPLDDDSDISDSDDETDDNPEDFDEAPDED